MSSQPDTVSTANSSTEELLSAVNRVIELAQSLAPEGKGKRRADGAVAELTPTGAPPTPGPSPKKRKVQFQVRSRTPSPSPTAKVQPEECVPRYAQSPTRNLRHATVRPPQAGGAPNRTQSPNPNSRTPRSRASAPPIASPAQPGAAAPAPEFAANATLQRQLAESRAHVAALSRIALVDYDVAEAVVYQMRGVLSGMMARIRRERELVEGVVEDAETVV